MNHTANIRNGMPFSSWTTANWMRGVVLVLSLLVGRVDGFAQSEKIHSFHSEITIHADGSMTVEETIDVVGAGRQIRRGIFRTFPTRYQDRFGNTLRVRFEVKEVLRDGRAEPYFIEKAGHGVKVYIGQKDVYLQPGAYTYTLVYHTDRQIGFFEEFDEIYWNVTGVDWDFVIDQAGAVIHLPEGARILNTAAYTGPAGGRGQDFSMHDLGSGAVQFQTTRSLAPAEGLTVAVSFNKGVIAAPTTRDKAGSLMRHNPDTIAALAGLALLLLYYGVAWMRVGVDPPRGTIIPRFAPPEGYSPAAVRFVMKMGYCSRVFAAAVVNLAVKGIVTIHESKGKFTLKRVHTEGSNLSKCEQQIANKLFGSGDQITFEQDNHQRIQEAVLAQKKWLRTEFEKMHFRSNRAWLIPGYVISLSTLAAIVRFAPAGAGAVFMILWLSGWTAGCYFLVKNALTAWKSALSQGVKHAGQAIGISLFALPFLAGELIGIWAFSTMVSPVSAILLLLIILVNILFYQLIKAPTILGRRVMDQIEGFRMYLETAEGERLNILNFHQKTPELFERYLPYAMALGVENAWSLKFTGVLARAAEERNYSPAWYSGRDWRTLGAIGLASRMGSSFSSAISS
ncbi:MAG TPA: DUF2207 domain-containing protein, partial [bacterium]|nr:DUF2207 domain-containing protein [bacterium]